MPPYLFQAAYTSEAWAVQVSNPQNRVEAIRSVIERLGGRLERAYLSFGDYDVVVIAEMPDSVRAAAFSLATSAGGALKAIKTTPLLTIEEGMEAMKKAAGAGYRPPGRS
jgi:uncharacterized protein with GYD domain